MSNADHWYQRVIYDVDRQRGAIREALARIAKVIPRYTAGTNEGPGKEWMVHTAANMVAQHLLEIAVAFKSPQFIKDQEWRIVCCPRMNPLSSAPKMADEDFTVAIKVDVRRHVSLIVPRGFSSFGPLLIPPIPFLALLPHPHQCSVDEVIAIREVLRANGRTDLFP